MVSNLGGSFHFPIAVILINIKTNSITLLMMIYVSLIHIHIKSKLREAPGGLSTELT